MSEAGHAHEQASSTPEGRSPARAPGQAASAVAARTPGPLTAPHALQLQRAVGNRAVAKMAAGSAARALARCACQGTCRCKGTAHKRGSVLEDEHDRIESSLSRAVAERRLQRIGSATIATGGAAVATGGVASSESGSRGDPAPAPSGSSGPQNPANCSVRVEATRIQALGGLPVWHLSIVHTDGAGVETGWRGGPGGPGGDPQYGTIRGDTALYQPGWVDYDRSAPSETVGTGSTVCGKTTCFETERVRINGTATTYAPTGPNSNTWVKTVLENCGLPARKPVWIAPGFGDPKL